MTDGQTDGQTGRQNYDPQDSASIVVSHVKIYKSQSSNTYVAHYTVNATHDKYTEQTQINVNNYCMKLRGCFLLLI